MAVDTTSKIKVPKRRKTKKGSYETTPQTVSVAKGTSYTTPKGGTVYTPTDAERLNLVNNARSIRGLDPLQLPGQKAEAQNPLLNQLQSIREPNPDLDVKPGQAQEMQQDVQEVEGEQPRQGFVERVRDFIGAENIEAQLGTGASRDLSEPQGNVMPLPISGIQGAGQAVGTAGGLLSGADEVSPSLQAAANLAKRSQQASQSVSSSVSKVKQSIKTLKEFTKKHPLITGGGVYGGYSSVKGYYKRMVSQSEASMNSAVQAAKDVSGKLKSADITPDEALIRVSELRNQFSEAKNTIKKIETYDIGQILETRKALLDINAKKIEFDNALDEMEMSIKDYPIKSAARERLQGVDVLE